MDFEWIQLIQKEWKCQVRSVRGKRKAFLLDTNRGPLFVKSYSSIEKVKWVISLSEQLIEKGFSQTLQYIYTTRGLPFLPYLGRYYVATKAIKGRDARYSCRSDIMAAIRCLGQFHQHARHISGGPLLRTASAPLIAKWEDRYNRFFRIIAHLKKGHYLGGLEKKIVRYAPVILSEAETALDLARRSPLSAEYQQAVQARCVSHRDLASHNFIMDQQAAYLIDYDTAMYDTQLVDIIQMLNRTLDEQAWDFEVFADMIEEYQKMAPMTEAQTALSFLLLRYPDNFMREVVGLYEGSLHFIPKKIESYLTMIIRNWPERSKFFQGARHFFYEEEFHSPSRFVV
ncbi:phosphotransferase [Ammoniphilus sp. 3BR4]|uniref:phosphotransferase n=1 Tax=Ammoniphilus sp. 3BR4 TaxID=3158265 RepID=UPI0034667077